MLIDTHSHVNFNAFKADADETIGRALADNTQMINVGSQYSTSQRAIEMAEKYQEGVYAAVGLHPVLHRYPDGVYWRDGLDQDRDVVEM